MTEQAKPERVLGDGARGEDEPQPGAGVKPDAVEAAQEPTETADAKEEEDDHDGDA